MRPRVQQFLLIGQVEVAISEGEVAQIRDANGVPGQVFVLRELGLVHVQDLREFSGHLLHDILVRGLAEEGRVPQDVHHEGENGRLEVLALDFKPLLHLCTILECRAVEVRSSFVLPLVGNIPHNCPGLCSNDRRNVINKLRAGVPQNLEFKAIYIKECRGDVAPNV